MTEKEKLQDLYRQYELSKMEKEKEYSYNNELKYLECAISFLRVIPEDVSLKDNILVFCEDEIDFLEKRKSLLIREQCFSDAFFSEMSLLRKQYPMSYSKHSLYCDYLVFREKFNDIEKDVYKEIWVGCRGNFFGQEGFDKFRVFGYLRWINKEKDFGLIGRSWKIGNEMLNYQRDNGVGYYGGYVAKL